MEKIITLENISKTYNGRHILNDISHDFYRGESIAFTGHNGCGKSTLLKAIAGLIRISKGNIKYHNKIRFSYVPEKFPGLDITVYKYLSSVAEMEGVDYSDVQTLIEDFFLEDMVNIRMSNLSKGSLQKVGVIQALMAPHDVILLDEPLSGQDADSQNVFITKIRRLKERGITVIMSCHEKKLIEELSDKQFSIEKGKLIETAIESVVKYRISVKANDSLEKWPIMRQMDGRNTFDVKESDIKAAVMKLYDEGWEIIGIEEHI